MEIIKIPTCNKHNKDIANYYAQCEINDSITFFELMDKQFERTILFNRINVKDIQCQILEAVYEKFFDENHVLKDEYVEKFYERYNSED